MLSSLFFLLLIGATLSLGVVVATKEDEVQPSKKNCKFGLTANDIAASSGLDLTGKIALVTGGRSGLGYAISEALLRQNCTVIIASRDVDKNPQAVASLKAAVGRPTANISYAIFDLEDFNNIQQFASALSSNYTHLDYYFANAGQAASTPQPFTVDGYERIFQVNYVGQFLLLQLLLPLLRRQPQSESDDQQQPAASRVFFTGSSSHVMACGTLGFKKTDNIDDDNCFGDDDEYSAISTMLPLDEVGLDEASNNNHLFGCPPMGVYPITKYLFVHLAKEMAKREADDEAAGSDNGRREILVYSWAPGDIRTNLNRFATCCYGPVETMGSCHFVLPYVGPTDSEGNPAPAGDISSSDRAHYVSPTHGAMAALYAALHAEPSQAGSYFATYYECEPDKGLYSQGLTDKGRAKLYDLSLVWAGLADEAEVAEDGLFESTSSASAGCSVVKWLPF